MTRPTLKFGQTTPPGEPLFVKSYPHCGTHLEVSIAETGALFVVRTATGNITQELQLESEQALCLTRGLVEVMQTLNPNWNPTSKL